MAVGVYWYSWTILWLSLTSNITHLGNKMAALVRALPLPVSGFAKVDKSSVGKRLGHSAGPKFTRQEVTYFTRTGSEMTAPMREQPFPTGQITTVPGRKGKPRPEA